MCAPLVYSCYRFLINYSAAQHLLACHTYKFTTGLGQVSVLYVSSITEVVSKALGCKVNTCSNRELNCMCSGMTCRILHQMDGV